jgi:hypothetical protein
MDGFPGAQQMGIWRSNSAAAKIDLLDPFAAALNQTDENDHE